MNDAEIRESLKKSLEDHRISRNEKQILNDALRSIRNDKHKLNVFRAFVFDIARDEMTSPEDRQVAEWIEDVMKLLKPVEAISKHQSEAFFSSQDSCANKIVAIINRMRHSIEICVFTVTDDRITDALINAHQRGVRIRIITDDEKAQDPGSDCHRLAKAGIAVRTDADQAHMHHKYAIFDGQYLLTGSYNWTRSADKHNKENFIVTNDKELVSEFIVHFEETWVDFANQTL